MTEHIARGKDNFINEKLDILGELYYAANSIVYLSKYL